MLDWTATSRRERRRPIAVARTPAGNIEAAAAIQNIRPSYPVIMRRSSPKPSGAMPNSTAATRKLLLRGERIIKTLRLSVQ